MRSIFMMSTANLRKRKNQSLLIGFTLLLSALLLSASVGILENLKNPFHEMFEQQNGSHITLQLRGRIHDDHQIARWWETSEFVEGVHVMDYYMTGESINHNGKSQSVGDLIVTEHPGMAMTQDKLTVVEGETKDAPGKNELWIPTGFAYSWGIKPGDELEIHINGQMKSFEVSAVVVDPQYSASMMNPVRIWAYNGMLTENLLDAQDMDAMIGIRLFDYSSFSTLWTEFEDYLGTPFFGFVFDYESIEYFYSVIQSIIGIIMLLFSIIIILVSVFVIAFTISNAVISDYKVIGILKSQGFSAREVKRIYSLQYLFLAAIFVPPGILFSKPVVNGIMSQMIKSLGTSQLNISFINPGILTSAVMLIVVFLASYVSSSKAGGIKPAEAIRNAAPSKNTASGKRFNITTCMRMPLSLLLGIKNIAAGKRDAVFTIVSAAVMAFVLVFSINTYNSVKNMDKNLAFWGFDDSEVLISQDTGSHHVSNEQVLKTLYADDRVKAAVPYSVIINAAAAAQSGEISTNVIAFTYDGDMDSIGLLNLEGRSPEQDNEVSISYLTARRYNKNVGDFIDLYIEGEKGTYLVTGIYQSMNAMGWGFRIQEKAVQKSSPDFRSGSYSVKLKEGNDIDLFVGDMKKIFDDSFSIRSVYESGEINISSITSNMALVALMLSIIFMTVAFIISFNANLMSIFSHKKSFGIYKALGMTPVQIRVSMVWKDLVLASSGILAGIPLSLVISPKILSMLLSGMGLVNFPFDVTLWGTLAAIPICMMVVLFSAWIPSGKILGISPRDLIVE
ncbi:ABC transporter permease [Candidatus Contubernalis alkaliaceticus]|uniref:ABC transporter permease n=1 Tax=Candidatus Contubernalis alkaliaceticus TaxID=338645 RepID=UPI001F4BF4B4|nr:FtsX-like permease family protein [Candidatus Contubernalis alkalaceticus]UNC92081.1 FtsX-like permease family protein [Candidatus Contubernalis alkalaceticus]